VSRKFGWTWGVSSLLRRPHSSSVRPAYRAETGGFGPHSVAKLLLTRTASATETSETLGALGTNSDLVTEPTDVARGKEETTCERHATPQCLARTGVSTKKAQALNLSLFR
jgi:hypothetical protein